jgi:6-phosphogluconolactonase
MKTSTILFSSLAALILVSVSTSAQAPFTTGAVFAMTNDAANNEVVAFDRDAQGRLTLATSYATQGLGTGAALGSQDSVIMRKNGKFLVVVNAGSDEITVFSVSGSTLTFTDKQPSGGDMPVSLALRQQDLFVLHAGTPNSITGFTLNGQGMLTPIPNSTQPLSAAQTSPAQVGWNASGTELLVTEKDTDLIDRFSWDPATNIVASAVMEPSSGRMPFGFRFRGDNHVFVSEAFTGLQDQGSVSSYTTRPGQALQPVDPSVQTTETSTCWLATTGNQKYLYVSNTGSNSISGFSIAPNASDLTLLDPTGVSATTGNAPADLAIVRDARYLYVLNSADGTISGFSVDKTTGSLASLQPAVAGLPLVGAGGLVAR